MEAITKHNYEAFYLDYLEGNLNEIETAELFRFLDAHPDIKVELEDEDDLLSFQLHPESTAIDDKEDLKYFECQPDEVCLNNYQDWLVAKVEGDLSPEAIQKLDQFIADNDLAYEEKATFAAVLKPNEAEQFGLLDQLKQPLVAGNALAPLSLTTVDDWLVAQQEGLLNEVEQNALNAFVRDEQLEHEAKAMMMAVLKPNMNESFGDRSSLIKKPSAKLIPLFTRIISIAAVLTILFMAVNWQGGGEDARYISRQSDVIFIEPEHLDDDESILDLIKKSTEAPINDQPTKPKVKDNPIPKASFVAEEVVIPKVDTNQVTPQRVNQSEKEKVKVIKNQETIKPERNDLALSEPVAPKRPIRLKDKYKPITNTINNHTNLDVTYQQTDQSSEVEVTRFKIGRFSYERKRRR